MYAPAYTKFKDNATLQERNQSHGELLTRRGQERTFRGDRLCIFIWGRATPCKLLSILSESAFKTKAFPVGFKIYFKDGFTRGIWRKRKSRSKVSQEFAERGRKKPFSTNRTGNSMGVGRGEMMLIFTSLEASSFKVL